MMTWKEALETPITIYWWNLGKKTLDFEGPAGEYLQQRGVTITLLRKRHGFTLRRLEFECGGHVTLDRYETWPIESVIAIIRLFLTQMGDRATFSILSLKYKLNWR